MPLTRSRFRWSDWLSSSNKRTRLGGPLLPSNEVNSEWNEERVLMGPREAAGTVIECKSRFAIREEAV